MDVHKAITTRRTIRRFQQKPIEPAVLERIVNAGRLAPSGANCQPVEFILVTEPALCRQVFATTAWAGRVTPRRTPQPAEQPTAWVVVLLNSQRGPATATADAAAAIENMLLTAVEASLGSCWIGSVQRKELAAVLSIPDHCPIDSVVAFGFPDESPLAEDTDDDIAYYLDDNDVLHVPKRKLKDVLHRQHYGS
ncbi:MAG: nitroreductase family protein [Phycisphaerae bacterium]|nr:nitroreductase family protein [Phycisphaerae bacterium]